MDKINVHDSSTDEIAMGVYEWDCEDEVRIDVDLVYITVKGDAPNSSNFIQR